MTRLLISTSPRLGPKRNVLDLGVEPNPDLADWRRSSEWAGGFNDGVFTLTGDSIYAFFDSALGNDVTEFDGNSPVWDGFIYEMVLHTYVDRIRTYDEVYNRVSAYARNLLSNGGFEIGLTNWEAITTGGGSVTLESTNVARGVYAVEITAGTGGGRNSYIQQTCACQEKTTYRLTFYSDSSAGTDVRYFIDSNVGIIVEVEPVSFTSGRFRRTAIDFVTQTGATSITVGLACPEVNSETSFFDDVRLERLVDEKAANVISPSVFNQESINTYGEKQYVVPSRFEYMAQAEGSTQEFLEARAFPATVRGGISNVEEPSLDVYVRGYSETTEWLYWALQTGQAELTLAQVFERIVDTNEFLTGYVINGNPPNVALPDSYDETQADILQSLQAQIGVGFRIHVGVGGLLLCDVNDFTPAFYMRDGELYNTPSEARVGINPANIRNIRPGIVRDLDYPITGPEPGSAFQDRRDFLMSSVEVDQDGVNFGT